MRNEMILLVCFLTGINYSIAQPEVLFRLNDGYVETWAYVGGDEFDGASLNLSKWQNSHNGERVGNVDTDDDTGTNNCIPNNHYYTDGANISVSGGTLKLIAKNDGIYARGITYKDDTAEFCDSYDNLRFWQYTTGEVYSNQIFKNGMFRCRFKAPAGKGLWPAFWLYGNGSEIDGFELMGDRPTDLHWDIHGFHDWACHYPPSQCPPFSNDPGGWLGVGSDLTAGFHELAFYWQGDIIEWYLDGYFIQYEIATIDVPMNLIANLGISNGAIGEFSPAADGTTPFPATFEIDYIRVYSLMDCEADDVPLCSYYSSNYQDLAWTGTYVTAGICGGVPDCPAGSSVYVVSGHEFKMVATEHIVLGDGFTADEGSTFEARIEPCFQDRSMLTEINDGYENIYEAHNVQVASERIEQTNADENIRFDGITVFPNPASGVVTVRSQIDQIQSIKILDVVGREVAKIEANLGFEAKLDISSLSKGTYTLEVETDKVGSRTSLIVR